MARSAAVWTDVVTTFDMLLTPFRSAVPFDATLALFVTVDVAEGDKVTWMVIDCEAPTVSPPADAQVTVCPIALQPEVLPADWNVSDAGRTSVTVKPPTF